MSSELTGNQKSSALSAQLLTAKEAAAYLTISPRTLWSLTNKGQVRSVRIGRSVRYAIDDLDEFISGRKGVNHVEA